MTPGGLSRCAGTLVELEPPWIGSARAALGDEIPEERLVAAVRAEMAYYKEHSHEGRDPESLADLRERSAAVLSEDLGREVPVEDAGRVDPLPAPTRTPCPPLEELRGRGLPAVCVSNWDCSLREVLERCGLARAARRRRLLGRGGRPQARPGDLRAGARARRLRRPRRRSTSATPPRRTSRAQARPGIRALLVDRERRRRHRLPGRGGRPLTGRGAPSSMPRAYALRGLRPALRCGAARQPLLADRVRFILFLPADLRGDPDGRGRSSASSCSRSGSTTSPSASGAGGRRSARTRWG